jgi:salicylate hydroxylase
MKVMKALGLDQRLLAAGFRPERIEMRSGRTGMPVFSIPLAEVAEQRWGAPYLHIHRADLLGVLADAVLTDKRANLLTGTPITGYEQDGKQVSARTEDGKSLAGDLLIGADGIHSAIREQMLGPEKPRFTGNIAWRAVVPVERLGQDIPPPSACIWTGTGRHAVTYLLRGGELANFVGIVRRRNGAQESWAAEGSKDEMRRDFGDWHPIIGALVDKADRHYRWALFDRPPLPQWSDGRAVLLGDACHPMLPTMAQGAVMAIEDGWVLADLVSNADDPATALQNYYDARIARVTRVQETSRANARIYHLPMGGIPVGVVARLAPNIIHGRQDWLYGASVV